MSLLSGIIVSTLWQRLSSFVTINVPDYYVIIQTKWSKRVTRYRCFLNRPVCGHSGWQQRQLPGKVRISGNTGNTNRVGIIASIGVRSVGPVFFLLYPPSRGSIRYSFWFVNCTKDEASCALTHPTLCPCLWDPVTMLTECPTPERSEPRPTLRLAVTSAAPCQQSRLHSRQTVRRQEKLLGFSWNGLLYSLSWSSSQLLEETSSSFLRCHSKESCRTPPTTFWCRSLWLICWWDS